MKDETEKKRTGTRVMAAMDKVILKGFLPLGFDLMGRLVTMPKSIDPPTIGYIGRKGSGKSMFLSSVFERMYWYWNYPGVFNNDWNGEMHHHTRPLNTIPELMNRLKNTHEKPTGMPIIPCVPDNAIVDPFYFRICKSFQDFLTNPDRFCPLQGSAKYVKKHAEIIAGIRSLDDLDKFVDKMSGRKREMAERLQADFSWIYKDKIFDITSSGTSKLKIEGKDYEVIPGLILLGLIPALFTSNLKRQNYFSRYVGTLIEDIYDLQTDRDSEFYKRKLYVQIAVDELKVLCSGKASEPTPAEAAINQCIGQGRMARLPIHWATQNISQVNPIIAGNSTYLFAFRTHAEPDRDLLKRDYDLPLGLVKQLPHLKTHECIAITGEHFVVFDNEGNASKVTEPMRMLTLPPLSNHGRPSGNENDD